eukprot:1499219-Prymnesium_polylepis.2
MVAGGDGQGGTIHRNTPGQAVVLVIYVFISTAHPGRNTSHRWALLDRRRERFVIGRRRDGHFVHFPGDGPCGAAKGASCRKRTFLYTYHADLAYRTV